MHNNREWTVKQIKFSQKCGLNLKKNYLLKYITFIEINTNYNIILTLSHYTLPISIGEIHYDNFLLLLAFQYKLY